MEDKRSPKEEKERRERNKKQIKTQSNLFKKQPKKLSLSPKRHQKSLYLTVVEKVVRWTLKTTDAFLSNTNTHNHVKKAPVQKLKAFYHPHSSKNHKDGKGCI